MRKHLPITLFLPALLLSLAISSQQPDRFAYSITGDLQQEGNWSYLRQLNLQTGQYSDLLLDGANQSFLAYDASSKKQFQEPVKDARFGIIANAPFGTGVATLAYDKRNNRLYYTPMFIDQLRYIDLATMKVYYVTDNGFSGQPVKSSDQGNIITRMTIASDGNGYALTNNANQLIRFTTGKKIQITDLGAVVDDPANKGISIHNSCTSFGGDVVADDDGNLLVFSARNHVFKINIETKVATHLGSVSGLPSGFSINGTAVNDQNKIIVGTAARIGAYFVVDPETLAATPYTLAGNAWNSSDLANSNLLITGKRPPEIQEILEAPATTGSKVNLFPNPVTGNQFSLRFNELPAGAYSIQVSEISGRQVLQQPVTIGGKNQTQAIQLGASASKGVYLVKVIDVTNRIVYDNKIVIQ